MFGVKNRNEMCDHAVCFVDSRAAWWVQGRPRTRLRSQRRQEPGPDLLRRARYKLNCITQRSFPQQDGLFVTNFFFFLFFTLVSTSLPARTSRSVWLFSEGVVGWGGGGFLSPEDLNTGLRLFTILLPVFLWAKAVDPVHLNVFPPFHFKNMTLCIFVEQKIAKL